MALRISDVRSGFGRPKSWPAKPAVSSRPPAVRTNKRQRLPASALGAVGPGSDPVSLFGENSAHAYGVIDRRAPATSVEYTTEPAFLAMAANASDSYTPATKFEFWITEVNLSYGAKGQTSASKFHEAFYARSFDFKPIQIKGRVPDENYFDNMVEWVRNGQVQMARGIGRMWLEIPAAKIYCWGFIPSFNAGHETGYSPAPEINFDFIVTRDRRTSKNGEISQAIIPYFLDPSDKVWRNRERAFKQLLFGEDSNLLDKERPFTTEEANAVRKFTDLFGF